MLTGLVNPVAGAFSAVALLPVVAAFGWAIGQVMVRRLATTESDATIMLFLNTGMAVGLGAMAPERRGDLARLGLRAMTAGALACWMTGAIAGIFAN